LILAGNCNIQLQNDEGNTALHYAVKFKESDDSALQIISMLTSPQVLKLQNVRGETVLHLASWYGNTAIVKQLLKAGADPNDTAKYVCVCVCVLPCTCSTPSSLF
jgi:ankyrin repeat protein